MSLDKIHRKVGIVLEQIQAFEETTTVLLAWHKANLVKETKRQQEVFDCELKKTQKLKPIIDGVKKIIQDDGIKKKLDNAVNERDFLVHHFFRQISPLLLSPTGRSKIILRLEKMFKMFEDLNEMFGKILNDYMEKSVKIKEMDPAVAEREGMLKLVKQTAIFDLFVKIDNLHGTDISGILMDSITTKGAGF